MNISESTHAKLKDLVTIQSGYSTRGKSDIDPNAEYALLKISDIDDEGRFYPDKLDRFANVTPGSQHLLSAGDVVFATRGTHKWAIYIPSAMPDVAASSHLYILRGKEPGLLEPSFLAWYLNQNPAQAYFKAMATGTHVPRVNQRVLQNLEMPLPPMEVQQRLARAGRLAVEEYRLALEHARRRRELIESLLLQRVLDKDA